jgi:uncharacterized protein
VRLKAAQFVRIREIRVFPFVLAVRAVKIRVHPKFRPGLPNECLKRKSVSNSQIMKTNSLWGKLILCCAGAALALPTFAAEPKKLLVVTVTTGFRHSSIETAEKVIEKLGKESGVYTVDFVRQPPNKPNPPKRAKDAPVDDAFKAAEAQFKQDEQAWQASVKTALAKLSPENLKQYDGVIFANTTGDLPLPDKQGFIDWIKEGHAFIGMHSATDTFHGFRPFIETIGGEFQSHGAQASVDCNVGDQSHPACKHLSNPFTVFDEIYLMKSYDQTKVRELLTLDKEPNKKTPGHFPVAWCKQFGNGKVFYTSLGHREDVWNPEEKNRKNSIEIAEAYQKHIMGGIKWALGLEPGDATPQAK